MNNLKYFRSASSDVALNRYPYRENGNINMTPGMREILRKEDFNNIRKINVDIDRLKNRRSEIINESLKYSNTYDTCEGRHSVKVSDYECILIETEQQLAMKEIELKRFITEMEKRGVFIGLQVNDDPLKEMVSEKIKQNNWKEYITFFLIYVVTEAFSFFTQFQSLRDFKSIEDVGVRALGILILMASFHYASYLNKRTKSTVYSILMGFNILMISIMMFAPPILHYTYPEKKIRTDSSAWSINGTAQLQDSIDSKEIPLWVGIYRTIEWAPAVLGLIGSMIIFSITPNIVTNNTTISFENKRKRENIKIDDYSWAKNQLIGLKDSVNNLSEKRNNLQLEMQSLKNNSQDIIPIQNILDEFKKKVDELEEKISYLEIKQDEIIADIESELNEYRTEYHDIISMDEFKRGYLKPEWPDRQDIYNYYKL